jgi:hypothetical protein
MYAAIRQGEAKAGIAEELARTVKEGAIPIISDVPGFKAYYVIYASDDTVTAISIFDDYAGAKEFNKRALAWIEQRNLHKTQRPPYASCVLRGSYCEELCLRARH